MERGQDLASDKEPTGKFVQAGDLRLHYHEAGTGYPLICLHGGGPGASAWSNFKQNFAELAKYYHTFLVDMPLWGKSDKPVVKVGRLGFGSKAIYDFMKAVGIEKTHFIGNSMGGQVAIKLAIDHPKVVDRLVIIGSTPVPVSVFQPTPVEAVKMIFKYYQGSGPSLERMRELTQTLVYDQSLVSEETIRERYEASIEPDAVKTNVESDWILEDLSGDLHRVRSKALVIWGLEDRAGALDIGLLMTKKFQNAQMHIYSKVGHWAQLERADEFNRLVLDFFS